MTIERGGRPSEERAQFRSRAACARAARAWAAVTDIDLDELCRRVASRSPRARSRSRATPPTAGTARIFSGGGLDPDKPIRDYTDQERHRFLVRSTTKVKVDGINLTYEGLVPKIQKSMLSKDREAMQPHVRAFVDGRSPS